MPMISSKSLFVPFFLLALFGFSSISIVSADKGGIRLPTQANGEGDGRPCAGSARPASCPINCFRADPVCGEDGVTYWCGCADALCHGVHVVRLGACDVGSGGSSSVPCQALLLVHIVWLILLGFSMLLGLF